MKTLALVGLVVLGVTVPGCGRGNAERPAVATTPEATTARTETGTTGGLRLDQDVYDDLRSTAAADCRTTPRAKLAEQNDLSPSVSDRKLAERYGRRAAHKGTPEARQAFSDGCYAGLERKGH